MTLQRLWLTTALAAASGAVAVTAGAALGRDSAPAVQAQSAKALAATAPHAAPAGQVDPADRRAFFGELHLHTVMSFDAWTFGTKVTPDQAYKFARGETVMVPAAQVQKEQGLTPSGAYVAAKRAWPLDFTAVTDHSEYLGAMTQLDDPNSAFSKSDIGRELSAGGQRAFFRAATIVEGAKTAATPDIKAAAEAADGWNVEMKAANANYEPGKFTTFVAYEWTASPGQGIHMHRNVIFDADHAPAPFTAVDSNKPENLWKYLESVRRQGVDVLAIPHNSNLSDGHDFDWNMSDGRPIDEAYALERALNEPLAEIAQTKGSSDTTPELSPSDEFANFEIMDRVYKGETASHQDGSYIRQAYGRGLVVQSMVGANPFKMGVVGASDIHNGLSVSDENGYAGGISGLDPKTMLPTGAVARAALGMNAREGVRPNGQRENDPLQFSSAGLTGVWAEQNTRASIFAALKRKETFATSGTRIRVRMFGGWTFDEAMLQKADWVKQAYAKGVPMGADLPAAGGKAPRFILQASKDPDGANLDRIQIIKVWLDGKAYKEKVFDVALSGGRKVDPRTGKAAAVGNTVNLTTGKYANTIGAPILTAVWQDPTFSARIPAVYYARVLEIPTPRWTTLLAIANHLPIPAKAPATIQERAWSSPIWFTPPKGARRRL
ncbi:MAG TPA: DUF3604 domain-containing protein [Phenylobacterium sp.]|jgi:hypothetical protein|uniref:DUF3604 domain-containing protein n=1 Tax=Phenylobacterium sp. TaxID=1871053 RepID=UPI002D3432DD|nr:DUF3604 domain-containing protein [Phenylobacterium sp.]HZZ68091.1 DUF3604 domain-containing protein [Phenylobacterium sp.]